MSEKDLQAIQRQITELTDFGAAAAVKRWYFIRKYIQALQ